LTDEEITGGLVLYDVDPDIFSAARKLSDREFLGELLGFFVASRRELFMASRSTSLVDFREFSLSRFGRFDGGPLESNMLFMADSPVNPDLKVSEERGW
jgi:hypothetical protein